VLGWAGLEELVLNYMGEGEGVTFSGGEGG